MHLFSNLTNLTLHLKVHFIDFVKEWTNDSENYTCNLTFSFARILTKNSFRSLILNI